jgi:replicative DNA helicase
MIQNLMINVRLFTAKISPLKRFQRVFLKRARNRFLRKKLEERLFSLELKANQERQKIIKLNLNWKKLGTNIDLVFEDLKNFEANSVHIQKVKSNFIDFIHKLEAQKDLEIKLSAIESVTSEFEGLNKKLPSQAKETKDFASYIKTILVNYLDKLKAEVGFWSLSNQLETIEQEVSQINEKLEII